MGRKKKEIKFKEPIRIREKELKDGNKSLYLDIYQRGERKKESLKLYLVPEVNQAAKRQNENTWKLAEQIKAQRILDIQENGLINWEATKKSKTTLVSWMERYVEDAGNLSSKRSRKNATERVKEYLGTLKSPDFALADVDKDFCKGFIAFLRTCTFNLGKKTLNETTCRMFSMCLSAALNMAVREGAIPTNPYKLLESKEKPQRAKTKREYLTIDEMKMLIATPCRYDIVKKAFLFSCFTGLRYCDMMSLRWSEIHTAADGVTQYIDHVQVKTNDNVTIPLSDEAKKWMPKQSDNDIVFHELKITSTTVEVVLGEWMAEAGIKKHITYHCRRHYNSSYRLKINKLQVCNFR